LILGNSEKFTAQDDVNENNEHKSQLTTRLIAECRAQFDQSIIDAAISQWRRRLSACVRVRRAHFEHKF